MSRIDGVVDGKEDDHSPKDQDRPASVHHQHIGNEQGMAPWDLPIHRISRRIWSARKELEDPSDGEEGQSYHINDVASPTETELRWWERFATDALEEYTWPQISGAHSTENAVQTYSQYRLHSCSADPSSPVSRRRRMQ